MEAETRTLDMAAAEVRVETTEAGRPVIRGIAMPYGSLSVPMRDAKNRAFREKFRPGAFSRVLATGADVRALVNHNRDLPLGRNKAGTLKIADDHQALRFELDPPDSPIAQFYVDAVRRGDMTGVSIRFYKIRDQWSGAGDATVREVIEADIDDISIVTYPAYPDTEVATRSLDEFRRDHPGRDRWLERAAVRLRLAEAAD